MTTNPTRVARWERRAEVPLLLLAVAFLVAYAWPVLDPRLDPDLRSFLDLVSWTVWAAFVVDFVARITLAEERGPYVLRHWYDVALIALPMLRPLRLLRLLAFARILHRAAVSSLVGRVGVYVGGTAVVAIALGAIAVLDAERADPGANITTFGDALWWATTTVTTVGYGDFFPVTFSGRVVGVTLMLVGISVVGTVTASVATWLISSVETKNRAEAEARAVEEGERAGTPGG
ncbi:potassium channel family protein [Nocardioides pantholopis]|uniref:potassium channel family protein n=1 Tax=Nocardioides pantholopis TaxID=2483798 RepID=UPI0019CF7867|nr:potassium channel family protein [Nocardioides pantholopis]